MRYAHTHNFERARCYAERKKGNSGPFIKLCETSTSSASAAFLCLRPKYSKIKRIKELTFGPARQKKCARRWPGPCQSFAVRPSNCKFLYYFIFSMRNWMGRNSMIVKGQDTAAGEWNSVRTHPAAVYKELLFLFHLLCTGHNVWTRNDEMASNIKDRKEKWVKFLVCGSTRSAHSFPWMVEPQIWPLHFLVLRTHTRHNITDKEERIGTYLWRVCDAEAQEMWARTFFFFHLLILASTKQRKRNR